jgi:hypothetical protein
MISLVTGMAVIASIQEGRHTGDYIIMFIVKVKVYLTYCFRALVNTTIKVFF